MNPVLGDADHDLSRVVHLVQFPHERNTVLHDVIEVVGQIVGKEHRDRERNEREVACLSGGSDMSTRQARKHGVCHVARAIVEKLSGTTMSGTE